MGQACRRSIAAGLLALIAAVAMGRPSSAQSATSASASVVTAAFLINFARFTEWPADVLAPDARLLVCVTDPLVAEALNATPGRTVGAHTIVVALVQPDNVPRTCSILYVSGLDTRRLSALAGSLRNVSVLSIADSEEFTKAGGVMQLYIEDGRMRFSVNVAAAERARLHLSSKLLVLARIVKE